MKQLLQYLIACWLLPAFAQTESLTDLAEVRSFVIDMQTRHGFTAADLLRDFEQIHALPAVIKAIQPPANPGIRSMWDAIEVSIGPKAPPFFTQPKK